MEGTRCVECGMVNWSADDATCRRCGGGLCPMAQTSLGNSLPSGPAAGRKAQGLIYLWAVGAGFLICVGLFIYAFSFWPKAPDESFHLVSVVIYAGFGAWFGFRRPGREWQLSLCLSWLYLLLLSYELLYLLRQNQIYGCTFWFNRFYFSPLFIFASPVLATLFGTRFGSRPSLLRLAPVACLFILTFIVAGYTHDIPPRVGQAHYSFEMTDGRPDNILISVDIKFGFAVRDEPMSFRAYPVVTGGDGGWKLTVIRMNPAYVLDRQMTMIVDGKEFKNSMLPINQPDGSSLLDFSKKQDYSQIVNWRIGMGEGLFAALVNAHNIEISWGNLNIVLPAEQTAALRNFIRGVAQQWEKEGLFCPNPERYQRSR